MWFVSATFENAYIPPVSCVLACVSACTSSSDSRDFIRLKCLYEVNVLVGTCFDLILIFLNLIEMNTLWNFHNNSLQFYSNFHLKTIIRNRSSERNTFMFSATL